MGVNIGELLPKNELTLKALKGRPIAIDAHNALYQFLANIRQPDGTPLRDARGRITSHLSGLLYRTARLVETGIKPAYVFDGKPSELKAVTIGSRSDHRKKAFDEWQDALAKGDLVRARTKATQSSRLTPEMIDEAIILVSHLGLPVIRAPSEGEAQASFMAKNGNVYAICSQDFDSLLFGAPHLIRNLAITGKRKLPNQAIYVHIGPEEVRLDAVLDSLGITHEQLVDLGLLVGTDFNKGVRGIGAKRALKLIKKHGSLEKVLAALEQEIEHYERIRGIFLTPDVTDEYQLVWRDADEERVLEFLCEERQFSRPRVEKALKKFITLRQMSLDQWF